MNQMKPMLWAGCDNDDDGCTVISMCLLKAKSINLQKKEETDISPCNTNGQVQ